MRIQKHALTHGYLMTKAMVDLHRRTNGQPNLGASQICRVTLSKDSQHIIERLQAKVANDYLGTQQHGDTPALLTLIRNRAGDQESIVKNAAEPRK